MYLSSVEVAGPLKRTPSEMGGCGAEALQNDLKFSDSAPENTGQNTTSLKHLLVVAFSLVTMPARQGSLFDVSKEAH